MCFKMTGNSSDDDSSGNSTDSDQLYSKIKPELRTAAPKNEIFYGEEWPNTLQSYKGSESSHFQLNISNVIKLVRNQSRSIVQNGCRENAQSLAHGISPQDLAKISSTINVQDLADIIGSVKEPQIEPLNTNSIPKTQSLPRPPPPPSLPLPPPPPPPQSHLIPPPPPVVPQYFNGAASLPYFHYPRNGIPVETVHYTQPNIEQYINPNNVPKPFIPTGSPFTWPPPATQHGVIPPFNTNSIPNTQPRDPRLLPRPQSHQNQQQHCQPPPSQSSPVQRSSMDRKSRWEAPMNRPNPPVKKIAYAAYKKAKSLSDQGDVNMAKNLPSTSNSRDNTRKDSADNAVIPSIDPKSSNNNVDVDVDDEMNDDNNDDFSNEPEFSPAASESGSATPTPPPPPPPPNENDPKPSGDDESNDSGDKHGDAHLDTATEKCQPIKTENDCESDASTDTDATVEFTYEAMLKHLPQGLDDQHSEPISNDSTTAPSMEQMNKSSANTMDEIENQLKDLDGVGEIDTTVQFSPTYTPDDELNIVEMGEVQENEMEEMKQVQNNSPELETNNRCFIYLMDIRNTALFHKYTKKVDEPREAADKPTKPAEETMKPVDEPLKTIEDLSPIELPDSDDEINDDKNDDNDDSGSDESKVVVISDSE